MWRVYAERVATVKKHLQKISLDIELAGFQPSAEIRNKLQRDLYEARAMLWAVSDDLHDIARNHEDLMNQHQFTESHLSPDAEGGVIE